ncbi:YmfQ family protein [Amantichitinum ursilacus]|uniref:Phage tail protein n=1 Tax=Amantichitinum ursilacus TaxID=857265 RepID=A0A0N0XK83_9NEIS|nr:putative phage tail protein [Amantichitinum ursilacus]KPC53036.1 hypothetical protein WG78_11115 [Amantichitinum ursilacus]
MDSTNYLHQAMALLPPGPAWPAETTGPLARQLAALADSFARVDAAARSVIDESTPANAYALLEDWEDALGLPDECSVQGSQTLSERRQAASAKYIATGGQRADYYIGIAQAYGYPNATVTEYSARSYGRARMGRRYGGWEWNYAWQLNLPAQQVLPRMGGAPFGEPYKVWGNAALECTINKLKPAHTRVFFVYGGA